MAPVSHASGLLRDLFCVQIVIFSLPTSQTNCATRGIIMLQA